MLAFAGLLLKNIPLKAGYFFFRLIGRLISLFPSVRKRTVLSNLSNITGKSNAHALVSKVYENYALYYFELFRDSRELLKDADYASFENSRIKINEYLEKYKGLILVSLHYNNWDLAGAFLSSLYPGRISVVVEELSDSAYKWFTETRSGWGMNVLGSKDLKGMLRALKNGHILVLLGDRDLEKNGYQLEFFGKKAYIPSGPAKLALMAGVPVVFSVFRRLKNDSYRFRASAISVFNEPPLERNEQNAEAVSRGLISAYEKEIKKEPEQWCMLQKVWIEEKQLSRSEHASGDPLN